MPEPGTTEEDLTVRIMLLVDPDLPAKIITNLARDLQDVLSQRVAADVTWEVNVRVNAEAVGEHQAIARIAQTISDQTTTGDWGVGLFVTDLPRRAGDQTVVAEASIDDRVGVVSLPALGPVRLHRRTRETIVRIVEVVYRRHDGGLVRSHHQRHRITDASHYRLPGGQAETLSEANASYVLSGTRGRLRLLGGMIRANRPWRLSRGLSKALVGASATAAFFLINQTAWQVATALDPFQLGVLAAASVVMLVGWLAVNHELLERPGREGTRHQAGIYNAATIGTLTAGVLCLYALFLVVLSAITLFLVDTQVLESAIMRTPGMADYLALATFVTSLAMIGGAVGSGLEDVDVVRRAAYGRRQRQRREQQAEHDRQEQDGAGVAG